MNQKHYSTLIIFVLFFISIESVYAQKGLKGRNNIKASHSYFEQYLFKKSHYFQLEYNRGITRFIEVGSFLSTRPDFYPVIRTNPFTDESFILELKNRAFHYGIQSNFHPLQLLLSEGHRFRLDLYINTKIGGFYSPVYDDSLRPQEHFFEYDIGAGLAYHLFQHWGIYAEYNYRSAINFRYGLSIKF
ncbi:hypothetical protein ABWH96_00140 [Marivirga tractuosa]|uniref:hypothetical protein n=1 Tax=Marivirga tractuosa TaxID=1006 RepID=UPI0035CE937D